MSLTMTADSDSIGAKWETAIRNKLFTSAAYKLTLLDETVLEDGSPSFRDIPMKAFIDDRDVKSRFQAELKRRARVLITARWRVPGLIFDVTQLERMFVICGTLDELTCCDDVGEWLFTLVRQGGRRRHACGSKERIAISANVILEKLRCECGRMCDTTTDAVYQLFRVDGFKTEADFLRVYGTPETMLVKGG